MMTIPIAVFVVVPLTLFLLGILVGLRMGWQDRYKYILGLWKIKQSMAPFCCRCPLYRAARDAERMLKGHTIE